MTLDVLVALVIAVGLIGIVVPMLPGSVLVAAAVLVWAIVRGEPAAWVTFGLAAALIVTGTVVKYLVPGKRLKQSGVPTSSLLAGGVLGVLGFFVIPVIGLPLGFVLGIYLAEWNRLSLAEAAPATVAALKAVGLGIAIELAFSLSAAITWAIGLVLT